MKLKTFPLYAEAYKSLDTCLTHVCEEGFPVKVLCGKAALKSVCSDLEVAEEASKATCLQCKKLLKKGN